MEDSIVNVLHRNYHIDGGKVTESVRNGKLDNLIELGNIGKKEININ